MSQRRLPGTEPGYLRIVLELDREMGWEVTVLEAQSPRFVSSADKRAYSLLSWDEAVEVVASCLDGITPAPGG